MSPRDHQIHPASEHDPDVWVDHVVEGDAIAGEEQLGTKDKFWVRRTQDDRRWLLKLARADERGTRGEDWAEWVVHKIAQILGTPSAIVVPATWNGRRGILSRNFVDVESGERLVHGNERLAERDPSYDLARRGENPRYTVAAVQAALRGIAGPSEGALGLDAFDVWTGYLVLDALVAGRDRHHENWGIIRTASGASLAPTFDHGNALGFQESDVARGVLIGESDRLRRWLDRGTSRHFAGKPHLADVAAEALSLASQAARQHWQERVALIGPPQVDAVLASIPIDIMSDRARTLAAAIVRRNRRRLLDDYSN